MRLHRGNAILLGLLLLRCGEGSAARGFVAPSALDSSVPAGTIITVVSGETERPAAGATLVVGGKTYTANDAGQVTLPEKVALSSLVDILAPNVLDRQTLLRSASATHFTLWPKTSPTGLDPNYTATLVYTDAGLQPPPPVGSSPLFRLRAGTTQVFIVPSADILADDAAHTAHEEAATQMTAATAGRIAYMLSREKPPGAVAFDAQIDPSDRTCDELTRAYTASSVRAGEIVGGRIVYCFADAARTATVTHEMGHTFGLNHSPDPSELMYFQFSRGRHSTFGPKETLAMTLMLQRRGGNMFPDNDRSAAATAFTGEVTVICR